MPDLGELNDKLDLAKLISGTLRGALLGLLVVLSPLAAKLVLSVPLFLPLPLLSKILLFGVRAENQQLENLLISMTNGFQNLKKVLLGKDFLHHWEDLPKCPEQYWHGELTNLTIIKAKVHIKQWSKDKEIRL